MSNRRTKVEFEHFLQIKGFCKTAIGIVRRQELRDRTHWAIKARKFDGAVWTRIELCSCQSLLKPGASLLVYTTAAFTKERRRARHKPVGAVRHWRRTPHARSHTRYPVCKRSSRLMSMIARESFVR